MRPAGTWVNPPIERGNRRRWEVLAPGVVITHSHLDHTASVILTREDSRGLVALVVDPAWAPDELHDLAKDVAAWEAEVVAGFATHAHYDHVLWHPGLGPAPRWAAPAAVTLARERIAADRVALQRSVPGWSAELLDLVGHVRPLPDAPDRRPLQGWAEVIVHDAHSPGHAALWLPDQQVLIAGDMLSDTEIPMLAETGAQAYLEGLELLQPYAMAARLLIPGHGSPTRESADRWYADHRYVQALLAGTCVMDERLWADANQAHHADNTAAVTGRQSR